MMANEMVGGHYRDWLVRMIKLAGQELIDRAEDMVSEGTRGISDFDIHIFFDQESRSIPDITWSTRVICLKALDELEKPREVEEKTCENCKYGNKVFDFLNNANKEGDGFINKCCLHRDYRQLNDYCGDWRAKEND